MNLDAPNLNTVLILLAGLVYLLVQWRRKGKETDTETIESYQRQNVALKSEVAEVRGDLASKIGQYQERLHEKERSLQLVGAKLELTEQRAITAESFARLEVVPPALQAFGEEMQKRTEDRITSAEHMVVNIIKALGLDIHDSIDAMREQTETVKELVKVFNGNGGK